MHPVGPKASQVYWVRRVLAVVIFVVLVVALVWWLAARGSGPTIDQSAATTSTSQTPQLTGALAPGASSTWEFDDETDGETTRGSGEVGSETDHGPSDTTGSSALEGKDLPEAKTDTSPQDSVSSTTQSSATPNTTSHVSASTTPTSSSDSAGKSAKSTTESKADTTTSTNTPTSSTEPAKPSYDSHGRLICADSDTALAAGTRSATYPVGAQPVLILTVTNTGSKPCVRDLSGSLQVFTVYTADGDRVWSTDDCFPGHGTEIRRLTPGESWTYPVTWAGTTSSPGCQTPRETVAAGSYTVIAAVGTLSSKPGSFTMTKP